MPQYETDQDLKNELEVVNRFAALGNYKGVKLPKDSGLDYLLYDENNKGKCFVEVKCFKASHTHYPTEILNLRKYNKMKSMELLAPVFFVCRYSDDVIMYIRSTDVKGEIIKIKRVKQRQHNANDTEWCIAIKKSLMKKLIEK
jgi:Holliday junction resolvase-like predicted endonuclease